MAILLPDFKNSPCMGLSTCNFFEEENESHFKGIERENVRQLIASYTSAGTTAYVRAFCADEKQQHIHIDVYRKELFRSSIPKATKKEIEKFLERFLGKSVRSSIGGSYIVPVDELPEDGLIRSTLFKFSQRELAVSTSGATLVSRGRRSVKSTGS
jgi:hypothetical protein